MGTAVILRKFGGDKTSQKQSHAENSVAPRKKFVAIHFIAAYGKASAT